MVSRPGLWSTLDEVGHATVSLVSTSTRRRLADVFGEIHPGPVEGFWSNVTGGVEPEANRRLHDLVVELVWPAVAELLPGWRLGYTSFVAKGSGSGTEAQPHQDWSMVEPGRPSALNVWIPLVDVHPGNGMIEVVPGSHRRSWPMRSASLPSPCLDFGGPVEPHLCPVPVAAGEALVYRHDVFHGSRANRSDDARVALALSALPPGARFVQGYAGPGTPDDAVDLYEVDTGYFYRDLGSLLAGRRPRHQVQVGRVPRQGAPMSAEAALDLLGGHGGGERVQ